MTAHARLMDALYAPGWVFTPKPTEPAADPGLCRAAVYAKDGSPVRQCGFRPSETFEGHGICGQHLRSVTAGVTP